jgi:membrane-associated phospholipid phosphatase
VVLNVLVILSVPAEGGHHLVDVFAGVLVAAVAWYLAGRIVEAGERSALPALIREPARFIPS